MLGVSAIVRVVLPADIYLAQKYLEGCTQEIDFFSLVLFDTKTHLEDSKFCAGSKWQNENLDLDTSDKLLVRGFVLIENLELKRIFEHTS